MRKGLVAALPLLVSTAFGSDESADDGPLTLTFDGSSCVYEGPGTLSPGPTELSFSNETEEIETVWSCTSPLTTSHSRTPSDSAKPIRSGTEAPTHPVKAEGRSRAAV